MVTFIIGLILLALNGYYGVDYVKSKKTTKSAAFTWFVIGFVASGLMYELVKLL
jgi:hypothetical protein